MRLKLSKSFKSTLSNKIDRYEFEVGILQDKDHLEAVQSSVFGEPSLKEYAGGPARKISRKKSGKTIAEIFVENMKRINTNLLSEPFQDRDSDLVKFANEFLKLAFGKGTKNRVVNLLQAVVRNPILRQEYGQNKSSTADNKGFDRHLIDTAQTFKNIKARIKEK